MDVAKVVEPAASADSATLPWGVADTLRDSESGFNDSSPLLMHGHKREGVNPLEGEREEKQARVGVTENDSILEKLNGITNAVAVLPVIMEHFKSLESKMNEMGAKVRR